LVHHRRVQIDPDALQDDPALLQQMLRSLLQQQGELHAKNDRLRLLIQRLSRHQFGRRSEHLTDEQLQLGLEDLEQTIAENQAAQDAAQPDDLPAPRRAQSWRTACPPAALRGGDRPRAGELPVLRRGDGGMPTEALIVHVLVSKFCGSLPLYRQAQMLGRQGIALVRSTLAHWVGTACWWLAPLYDLVVGTVLSSPKVFAMDTNVVERAIRPVTLNRKNALFAGSDGGARHGAIATTLIATAKLNGVEPMAWLTDVLERVVSGRTKANELDSLLPWNWKAPNAATTSATMAA
jgi:hypothetical protein